MRQVVLDRTGGPDVLRVRDVAAPSPGDGEILVAVTMAAVNFVDVLIRRGELTTPLPHPLGREGVGVITSTGSGVDDSLVGRRVAWTMTAAGAYADLIVLPASRAVPVPVGLSDASAAAVLTAGVTARLLGDLVPPGTSSALVHSAGGAVGLSLVTALAGRGIRVVATASTEGKRSDCLEAGATAVADSRDPGGVRAVGSGVDVVLDAVGAATWELSLDCLAPGGIVLAYGAASGPVPPIDLEDLGHRGSLGVRRVSVLDLLRDDDLREHAAAVLEAATAQPAPVVTVLPLGEAARAHALVEQRRARGKVLLSTG